MCVRNCGNCTRKFTPSACKQKAAADIDFLRMITHKISNTSTSTPNNTSLTSARGVRLLYIYDLPLHSKDGSWFGRPAEQATHTKWLTRASDVTHPVHFSWALTLSLRRSRALIISPLWNKWTSAPADQHRNEPTLLSTSLIKHISLRTLYRFDCCCSCRRADCCSM